jgi:subtilisin family serine protease
MYIVQYGGKTGRKYALGESDALVAVRTHSKASATGAPQDTAPLRRESREVLGGFALIDRFPAAGVEIYRPIDERRRRRLRNEARTVLKKDKAVRFAGRVLVDPRSGVPVLYSENCFVKFEDDAKPRQMKQLLAKYKLTARRALGYARNAWFVSAREGIGLDLFGLIARVLKDDAVELAHPELLRRLAYKGAFPNQWHLKRTRIGTIDVNAHANVEAAWALAEGAGVTIAVIDDGVDLDHEEFRSGGKLIAPRDVTLGTNNPRPGPGDRHGTACAGVACADGRIGASGVAPKARLIPIRFASALGSQSEADAFVWAAQNGADVISCSWGPPDGDWSDPNDPVHDQVVPLPDSTRLAIDFAVNQGRNGKGCVICFAAGNGNEPVDNDGYASYGKVMAIAACNDSGKKSAYSDVGRALWCAFPSNEVVQPRLTTGIWTTDNMGPSGYNPGQASRGDAAGNYTNSFGGTSSACPGAAGVAALILSRNPVLRWEQVRELMKQCCDRIDTAGGSYDSSGHSTKYGYGRLNALKAVELAVPDQPPTDRIVTATATQDVAIRDLQTSRLSVSVAETARLKDIKVTVDIEHTYIGDLVVSIQPPAALNLAAIVLHNRAGGSTDNLRTVYDVARIPGLGALAGKSPAGSWTLIVRDAARLDQGRIRQVSLEMRL